MHCSGRVSSLFELLHISWVNPVVPWTIHCHPWMSKLLQCPHTHYSLIPSLPRANRHEVDWERGYIYTCMSHRTIRGADSPGMAILPPPHVRVSMDARVTVTTRGQSGKDGHPWTIRIADGPMRHTCAYVPSFPVYLVLISVR